MGVVLEAQDEDGGMGVVLEAQDEDLRRRVAVKVTAPELLKRPQAKERFLREARAAAAIEHADVVPLHHGGEHGGLPFLVRPCQNARASRPATGYTRRTPRQTRAGSCPGASPALGTRIGGDPPADPAVIASTKHPAPDGINRCCCTAG
jgi:hypothetical protein